MADLFAALSTAARSLDAHRYALEVVGHNLANVNTPGYTRRTARLAEIQSLDLLGVGAGVEATGVKAERAPLLERRLYQERPAAGRERAVADQLAIVESGLGQPGSALDVRLSEFFDAFAALAEDPGSSVARRMVTIQGQSLAQAFQDVSTQISDAHVDVEAEVRGTVDEINALAIDIASLNVAIVSAPEGTSDALQDRRAEALHALAALVDIGVTTHDDGALDVTLGNGRALVAREQTYDVVADPSTDPATVTVGTHDVTDEITGGRLGGLLQVRDVLLPGYAARLDQLASDVIDDVNAVHSAGYGRDNVTGRNFFANPALVAGAAAGMAVDAGIVANGDTIAAGGVLDAPGDNQGARALAELRNANPSLIDDWASLVHRVGTDHATAKAELETREDVLRQLQSLKSQISGVSIDEEAATMLKFQRAYEANARFFGVVNGLLDVMMAQVGR